MKENTNEGGLFAAEENNNASATRGTFVSNAEDAPLVHPGASSSEIVLNIDQTSFRVHGEGPWDNPPDTVTLPANTGPYPRRDLVIAEKGATTADAGSFATITGDPITAHTWQQMRVDDPDNPHTPRLDENGLPLHPVEELAGVAPPDGTGLRDIGPILAMVFVPPGAGDSTDIGQEYITDLTKEGVSFEDVLRSGDAVEEIEAYDTAANGPVATTVADSAALGGHPATDVLGGTGYMKVRQQLPGEGSYQEDVLFVPAGWTLTVHAIGILSAELTGGQSTAASLYVRQSDGSLGTRISSTVERYSERAPDTFTADSNGEQILLRVNNGTASTSLQLVGYAFVTLMPPEG